MEVQPEPSSIDTKNSIRIPTPPAISIDTSRRRKTKRDVGGITHKDEMLFVPGFEPGPAHINGEPLTYLECSHIVMDVNDQIRNETENHKHFAQSMPKSLVGKHIFIYWEDDDVWYRAKVLKYKKNTRKFQIKYDDGNDEKIDLTQ